MRDRDQPGDRVLLVALAVAEGRPIGAAEINVVASIKPVHSLVAGVMEGVAEPVLLIRGTGSEHSYSLRPSQARALDQADVVFWVGETMETFLLKPLQAFSGDAKVIELWQIPGLALLPTREGGMWEAHDHGNERADADPDHDEGEHVEENEDEGEHVDADHEAAEHHAHGETDMHIWLDPANAKVLVPAIATALSDADPDECLNLSSQCRAPASAARRARSVSGEQARDRCRSSVRRVPRCLSVFRAPVRRERRRRHHHQPHGAPERAAARRDPGVGWKSWMPPASSPSRSSSRPWSIR